MPVAQPVDADHLGCDEDVFRRLLEAPDALAEKTEAFRGNLDDALGFDRGRGFEGGQFAGALLLLALEIALFAGLENAGLTAFTGRAFADVVAPFVVETGLVIEIGFFLGVPPGLRSRPLGAFDGVILKIPVSFAPTLAVVPLPATSLTLAWMRTASLAGSTGRAIGSPLGNLPAHLGLVFRMGNCRAFAALGNGRSGLGPCGHWIRRWRREGGLCCGRPGAGRALSRRGVVDRGFRGFGGFRCPRGFGGPFPRRGLGRRFGRVLRGSLIPGGGGLSWRTLFCGGLGSRTCLGRKALPGIRRGGICERLGFAHGKGGGLDPQGFGGRGNGKKLEKWKEKDLKTEKYMSDSMKA